MNSAPAIIELRNLTEGIDLAMLASGTPDGEIHSRPLTLAEIDDTGHLCFLVDATTAWVDGLAQDEQVNVSFADHSAGTWVSVSGTATVVEDRAALHRLWSKPAEAFFPDGPDSPDLRLLKVAAGSAEYWDAPSGRVARLALMATALLGERRSPLGESGTLELS